MSNIDKRALREATEKALSAGDGNWQTWREAGMSHPEIFTSSGHIVATVNGSFAVVRSDFIAAANPSTVLALLDELEAMHKYAKDRDAENEGLMITVGRLRVEKEAAESRIAELEAKKVKIKLPESFYPDGDIDCPLVINEYQIIEAIVAAGCKPIAVCPRCKCELDLSHKPDGAHYCHPAAADKGE
ncbi:TPA: ead/Ea22-like family protein [Enterobacter hormaechei]|nr:ead/Ea22-like family protein [Enterobacter hormaechei]